MTKVVVVTGAAGFVGCNMVRRLNKEGLANLLLVDKFDDRSKEANLAGLQYLEKIDRDKFIEWLGAYGDQVAFVFHLGARTDTAEKDVSLLNRLNLDYSKSIWALCTRFKIPLLYASSAATYGSGDHGFSDDPALCEKLEPLNEYGRSKHHFDLFVLPQKQTPPFWCGLKFFNVYGPYEDHKGRMASVAYHAFRQIRDTGAMRLFQSHHPDYRDGEQMRDFIYIDDVTDACFYFYKQSGARINSGIFNLGTGHARSFKDLARAIFNELDKPVHIAYIPTPEDIRDKYQYRTEAVLDRLKIAGYPSIFIDLEAGIRKYSDFLKIH